MISVFIFGFSKIKFSFFSILTIFCIFLQFNTMVEFLVKSKKQTTYFSSQNLDWFFKLLVKTRQQRKILEIEVVFIDLIFKNKCHKPNDC